MTVFTHPDRHRVAVLVRHGLMPLELGLVHQLFGQASARDAGGERERDAGAQTEREAAGRESRGGGHPLYEVVTCAPGTGEIRTDADFPVLVAHGPEALAEADTVIVPASHDEDETENTGRLGPALREALARIRPGTRIASICTGAYVLAAAALLDGRRATTHWNSAAHFRALYPAVLLDPDVLYTDEGDILTSAGEAAGIDLCLHMIRRDHGSAVANDVARSTVVPPHREGGQAQFIPRPVPAPEHRSTTAAARAWALRHLDRPVSLRELAECESMSVRTFTRRFGEEIGMTPVRWLTRQRLLRARELLEETDLTVDRVAAEAGFGTAASLRQHLQAALGVSPSAYRSTFRGSLPCPPDSGSAAGRPEAGRPGLMPPS